MSVDLPSSLITGNHIAVVGNCGKISQRKDGALIDKHDVVIRFNFAFPVPEMVESLGQRTDMMIVAKGVLLRTNRKRRLMRNIRRDHKDTHIIGRLPTSLLEYHLPSQVRGACKSLISREPTTGAITVHALMTVFNPASITVFGFDGLKTGVWYSDKSNSRRHRPKREQMWLESIKDKVAVIEYS